MTDIDLDNYYEFDDIFLDVDKLYYSNGKLIEKQNYKHPKDGIFKAYYEGKKICLEITFTANKKNGATNYFSNETQKICWTNYYTNDKLDGVCKSFYSDGKIKREETFTMGIKEGVEKKYDEQGNIIEETMWEQNAKHGFAKRYYSNGQIEHETQYVNDKAEGIAQSYYKSGEIKTIATLIENKIHGLARGYFKNGKLKYEGYYKKDKCEGPYKIFYENGKTKEINEYKNDKLHGKVQGFYKNGDLKFEYNYKNGLRNGYSVYYKKQTKEIITKHFYKNGELVDYINPNGIVGIKGVSNFAYEYTIKNIKSKSKNPNAWGDKNLIFVIITNKKHSAYAILLFNKKTNEPPVIIDKNTGKYAKEELINYASINNYIVENNKLLDDFLELELEENISSKLYHKTAEMLMDIIELNKLGIKHSMILYNEVSDEKDKEKNLKEPIQNQKAQKKKNYFNLDFVNCSRDIKFITERIIESGNLNFSICIHGEPGTGKSAYAMHLAEKLGLKVIKKTAADILDQYVGNSEQKIQEAFDEAEEKGAMLIIDEVDSFLRSRGLAQRNWEVTLVNQMLTSMENFNYPFVCTTNFIDMLDQASLRRFTFKFKFGFLKGNKIKEAFEYIFKKEPNLKITKMNGLTVSDFISVKKECDILNIEEVDEIANMLDEILKLKESEELKTNIGFN